MHHSMLGVVRVIVCVGLVLFIVGCGEDTRYSGNTQYLGGGVYGGVGVGEGEGCAVIPGGPLVHEPGAERVGGLAENKIEGAVVEVGEVGDEALGGTEGAAYLLDGEPASGLIVQAGPAPAANERQAAEHGMFDVDGRELAPSPLRE